MPDVGERLFHFLFKYPRLVFEQGDFTWAVSRTLLVVIVLAAAAVAVARCSRIAASSTLERPRDRVVLIGAAPRAPRAARSSACCGRRSILKAAVPQQNFLGVLLDDSRSMAIADRDGQTAQRVRRSSSSTARTARCCDALSQRFVAPLLPLLLVGRRAPTPPRTLKYAGTATRLGPALDRARDELAGLPLAGLVMVTDGADTSDAAHRRVARQPEGAIDSGVHASASARSGSRTTSRSRASKRRAPRSKAPRSSSTSCCRRPATAARPSRSTSKTMGAS